MDTESNSDDHTPLLSHVTPCEKEGWFKYRYVMTLMLFLACAVCYSHRVDLSIGIVAMTNSSSANTDFEDFDWDSSTRANILSSFFWGYIICQIPAGLLAQTFGAQNVLLGGVALSSVATLLTPTAAYGGVGAMYAVRVVGGLSQGALFPSIHAVLSKWGPPSERGAMASIAYSGSQFGTIITFPLGGVLASSGGGWPSIFYVLGGVGIVWCVLWFFLASSYPSNNRFISQKEKDIIENSLDRVDSKTVIKTPWKAILTSIPMWAIILGHSAQNWGYWTLMTEIPSYMDKALGFQIQSNGLLSALPYLVMALLSYLFGYLTDTSISKGWITTKWSRKIFNTIGCWGPAVALACLGYVGPEQSGLAVGILVMGVGLNAGVYLGFQINHIDLSPNFASTMMGITNAIANIFSIIGPLVVGFVVVDQTMIEEWRIIFWIAAAVYFFGNIVFCVMSDGVIQPWNEIEPLEGEQRRTSTAASVASNP